MSVHTDSALPDLNATDLLEGSSRQELEKHLLPGEKLLWCDRPNFSWRKAFRHFAPLIIYFGVAWIFLFIIMGILNTHVTNNEKAGEQQERSGAIKQPAEQLASESSYSTSSLGLSPEETHIRARTFGLIIILSGVVALFLTLWTYMVFQGVNGRALLHPLAVGVTYYGITDMRVLVLNTRTSTRLLSYHLLNSHSLRYEEDADGTGSIFTGKSAVYNFWIDMPPLHIQSIDQPARVFQLMLQVQHKLLRGAA